MKSDSINSVTNSVTNGVSNGVKNSVKNSVKNGVKNSVKHGVKHGVKNGVKASLKNSVHCVIAATLFALVIAVPPMQAQAPVRIPRSVLERYVGEYDQNGTIIKILLSGDTLIREIPGQRAAFAPITETLFRMGPVFTAEFVVDKAGGVTQVLTDGVAVEYRIPRKGSVAAPPAALPTAPVRVPRSVLERYVGTYEYIPGQMSRTDLRVEIRLKGDTLFRSMGQDAVLIPISETRFRVGGTSLETEFVIDDAGVTQVMGTGWQQLLARLTKR